MPATAVEKPHAPGDQEHLATRGVDHRPIIVIQLNLTVEVESSDQRAGSFLSGAVPAKGLIKPVPLPQAP